MLLVKLLLVLMALLLWQSVKLFLRYGVLAILAVLLITGKLGLETRGLMKRIMRWSSRRDW